MLRIARFFSLVCLSLVIVSGFTGCVQAQGSLKGNKAPDFSLESVEGAQVSSAQLIGGKKAILFFWATWCPHCREQIGALAKEKAKLTQEGIVVEFIDIGETKKTVKKFLESKGYDFDVLLDVDSSVAEQYQVNGIPTLVFIGEDGNIRDAQYGFPDDYAEILK